MSNVSIFIEDIGMCSVFTDTQGIPTLTSPKSLNVYFTHSGTFGPTAVMLMLFS